MCSAPLLTQAYAQSDRERHPGMNLRGALTVRAVYAATDTAPIACEGATGGRLPEGTGESTEPHC